MAGTAEQPQILVLLSHESGMPWQERLIQAFHAGIQQASALSATVFSEYTGLSRQVEEPYIQALIRLYQLKYDSNSLNLIVAIDRVATQFMLDYGETVFPGVPVIFVSEMDEALEKANRQREFTGIVSNLDIKGTLDTALTLQPETEQIVVISGVSENDLFFAEMARNVFKGYSHQTAFRYLSGYSLDELIDEVTHLPERSFIFYILTLKDAQGDSYIPKEAVSAISAAANRPVYGLWDTFLGSGIVGGHLNSAEYSGRKLSELALRVLQGEKPQDIAIEKGTTIPMFDGRQLVRWNLPTQNLPDGSTVRFKRPSFASLYLKQILLVAAVVLAEAALIFLLLLNLRRRKHAEIKLKQYQESLEQKIQKRTEELSEINHTLSREIEDRKQISRELSENRRFLWAVFNAIQDGISVLDTDLNVIQVNHTMNSWYAHNQPLTGKKCHQVFHGREDACDPCPSRRALESCRVEMNEVPYVNNNETAGVLELYAFPILDESGTSTGVVEYVRDITLRKKAETALKQSEQTYRDIFNTVTDGLAIIEPEGVFVDANPAFCSMYGYSLQELIGLKPTALIHPDYHQVYDDFLKQIPDKGRFRGETQDVRKDGSTFYTEARGTRIRIQGKNFLMAIIRDITENKLAEKALQDRELMYRSLFQSNRSIMLLLDPETGKIEDANPAACTFYGYTREILKGKDMSEINTLSLSELRAEMEQAIAERRNYFNFHHRLADGTIRDVEVYSGPIEIRNKMLLFSIIHDISDRKTVERERERLISELKTALAEIKTLSGLLPICASCKKIRDDKGYWKQLESYIEGHSQATFSHGICDECAEALYGEEEWYQKSKAKKLNRKPG